uniref:AlNc14C91G5710 protein n=1 Tax=Albugo laibachii Nc14 TaxID=890382 RepID=F0WGH7_9STRA|nr:AlNc14C91G5710 [Albugo laibachii Nc14]|eukprot:CCA20340.1 AlNc14C91G5710 [Albugo laibachii Nc14]
MKQFFTGRENEVHHSRLKFYGDSELETTEEIMAHVTNQDLLLNVESIYVHRKVQEKWKLLVKWKGLEEVEASWEPYVSFKHDVPTLASRYCKYCDSNLLQKLDSHYGSSVVDNDG